MSGSSVSAATMLWTSIASIMSVFMRVNACCKRGFAEQLAADVRLRREEQPVANVEPLREVADDLLGRAVDHGGVHDLAAELDEARHRVAQRRALLLARADAVAVRADADRRQHLAGLRNALLNQRARLRERSPAPKVATAPSAAPASSACRLVIVLIVVKLP